MLHIVNARLFDGESVLQDETVTIDGGVIVDVGAVSRRGVADQEIDARGSLVSPGLIDAHFHAYAPSVESGSSETVPLSYLALVGARRLRDALARGFTTVRDPAGGDAGFARGLAEGLIPGPRYFFTGPALSQTGGHGDERAADDIGPCRGGHTVEVVDGVDALRRAARERLRTGAHAIKILASGGVISPTDPLMPPQYSAEEIAAVTEEANRRGSYVAAHAYSAEAIAHAVVNGVRSIEHGNFLDAATAALMAERGAFLVPTLGTYEAMDRLGAQLGVSERGLAKNREVLLAGADSVRIAHEAGVPVGWGSDNMGELVSEHTVGVRLLAEASTPELTLRSLTSVNAALLRQPDLGRIFPGAAGDLVVWDGDPLQDIDAIADARRHRIVIQRGVVVSGA